jgi:hypothetical protein
LFLILLTYFPFEAFGTYGRSLSSLRLCYSSNPAL